MRFYTSTFEVALDKDAFLTLSSLPRKRNTRNFFRPITDMPMVAKVLAESTSTKISGLLLVPVLWGRDSPQLEFTVKFHSTKEISQPKRRKMGVPAFFGWLLRTLRTNGATDVELKKWGPSENVFVDMNGVIHPCCHAQDGSLRQDRTEKEMFDAIAEELDRLVLLTKPQNVLFLAIDGVAPAAKMLQQRERRLRSVMEHMVTARVESGVRETRQVLEEPYPRHLAFSENSWDSNQITPGTEFLARLAHFLKIIVEKRVYNKEEGWKNLSVIISDASVPGEGEHKLLNFLRSQPIRAESRPGVQFDNCIVGDDADLVMLALGLHRPRMMILRNVARVRDVLLTTILRNKFDVPLFLSDAKIALQRLNLPYGPDETYNAVDVDQIREGLQKELCLESASEDLTRRALDDILVLFSLAGNDFVPHMPSLDVRNDAMGIIIQCYRTAVLKDLKNVEHLVKRDMKINVKVLEEFFKVFSSMEERGGLANADEDDDEEEGTIPEAFLELKKTTRKRILKIEKLCKLRRDDGSCENGNRCENLHDGFVPRAYTLQRIRNAVLAFALKHTLGEMARHKKFAGLPGFGHGNFAFADGPQRAELVQDPKDRENFNLKVSGLDAKERQHLIAIVRELKLELEFNRDDGFALVSLKTKMAPVGAHRRQRAILKDWAKHVMAIMEASYLDEIQSSVFQQENCEVAHAKVNDAALLGEDRREMDPRVYYREKFNIEIDSQEGLEKVREISRDYVKSLQFIAHYYLVELRSWTWMFHHHYAPFARDILRNLPEMEEDKHLDDWAESEPVSPLEQLMAVLPGKSLRYVPRTLRKIAERADIQEQRVYPDPESIILDRNGRRFRWQWVALLPPFDLGIVKKAVAESRKEWTDREKKLDALGAPSFISGNTRIMREGINKKTVPEIKLDVARHGLIGTIKKAKLVRKRNFIKGSLDDTNELKPFQLEHRRNHVQYITRVARRLARR